MADHNEKGVLERVETTSETGTPTAQYRNPLEKTDTNETLLASVNIDNHQAFKGDDSDGKVAWSLKRLLVCALLAMLYTGSQLPLYFSGASLSLIAEDIHAANVIGWLPVANTLAIAAVCPFVGYLQDLFGKRYIALFGATLLVVGCILLGTAHHLGQALAGMALAGAGAGVGELTGLAGLAEIVPVKQRGYSLAVLTAFVLPFCPYVMYTELFTTRGSHRTWRWGIWISLIYNAITLVGLAVFYFPHAHVRAEGMRFQQVLKRIDYVGGFLSITGLTLFLVALQAGGYDHPWKSAYVLCTLLFGIALLCVWIVWEWKFAKHPMVPKELFLGQRVVGFAFAVAFVAGMNFFSLLNFWPLTIRSVWTPSPVAIGYRGLPLALATAVGAIFWCGLLSYFSANCNYILFTASLMLTAFGGSLASMNPHNVYQSVTLASFAGFGLGGVIVPAATVAMIACPDALITTCAALSLSVRAVGGAIGYSIYYSIFSKELTEKLPKLVGEYAVKAGLPLTSAELFVGTFLTTPTPEALAKVPGLTPQVIAAATTGAQWAYAHALHLVWYTSIAFGIVASASSGTRAAKPPSRQARHVQCNCQRGKLKTTFGKRLKYVNSDTAPGLANQTGNHADTAIHTGSLDLHLNFALIRNTDFMAFPTIATVAANQWKSNFSIIEATPNHVHSCSTMMPRAFHANNDYVRQCFPDTPLVGSWWAKIFLDEVASEDCRVLVAVDENDSPSTKVLGILCMRLLGADDVSAGCYSLYPFTPDHNLDMFKPAMHAMIDGWRKVFSGTGKKHWLIELFGVDHEFKGMGLGRRLLEKCFEIADQRREDVFVEANASAAGIYVKMGFESQGTVVMPGDMRYEECMLVRRTRARR
ncbi:hypothetical protein AC579_8823 [Pseudocercospora musae]|uniref:N-acetyltransferase domain-containing protein n=1 Tax=Pseudocercospora musae TaxID=113226 RepID=A0A139H5S6_9PEZI|nr:hypothetical protein AC579_8823 [Pseudocercospora musae]